MFIKSDTEDEQIIKRVCISDDYGSDESGGSSIEEKSCNLDDVDGDNKTKEEMTDDTFSFDSDTSCASSLSISKKEVQGKELLEDEGEEEEREEEDDEVNNSMSLDDDSKTLLSLVVAEKVDDKVDNGEEAIGKGRQEKFNVSVLNYCLCFLINILL